MHQWVVILSGPLHWACTSVNVASGTLGLDRNISLMPILLWVWEIMHLGLFHIPKALQLLCWNKDGSDISSSHICTATLNLSRHHLQELCVTMQMSKSIGKDNEWILPGQLPIKKSGATSDWCVSRLSGGFTASELVRWWHFYHFRGALYTPPLAETISSRWEHVWHRQSPVVCCYTYERATQDNGLTCFPWQCYEKMAFDCHWGKDKRHGPLQLELFLKREKKKKSFNGILTSVLLASALVMRILHRFKHLHKLVVIVSLSLS